MKSYNIQIRVRLKEGILDPQAEVIFNALQRLDFKSVQNFQCEKLFRVSLEAESEGQALDIGRKMAQQLLANLVMEDFDVELESLEPNK